MTGSLESGAEDELLRVQMLLMVSSLLHNFNLRLCSPAHGQGRGQAKADFTPQGTLLLRPRPFKVSHITCVCVRACVCVCVCV